MATSPCSKSKPPVGVYAKTEVIARSLIQEMRISAAVGLGQRSGFRGLHLGSLLVDESAWPLSEQEKDDLMPCLEQHAGYILRIERFDPKRKMP